MTIDRESLNQIGISVGSIGLFIALLLGIGVQYGSDLAEQGALALVGSIVFFIVLMTVVGFWLARNE